MADLVSRSVRFLPHWNPSDPRQVIGLVQLASVVVGELGHGVRWVEVGGYQGESATIVLGFPHVVRLDVIEVSQTHADALDKRFAGIDRCHVVHGLSVDAAATYADESVDVVYIDADHSYEGVAADLDAWRPKVRRGGFIGGHDYHDGFQGVKRAVNERLTLYGTFADSSWLARVP